MRIGIDATGLGPVKTGTVVYLTEILRVWNANTAIQHQFTIFTSTSARSHFQELNLDSRFEFILAPDNRGWRVLWQQLVMPFHIWAQRIAVHWGAGFVLPLLGRCPMVVSVHDLTFQLFPEAHERIKRLYFPAMIRLSVSKAAFVLAISETTRRDLHAHFPRSREKVVVTLLAARSLSEQQPMASSTQGNLSCLGSYVLFVGTLEPRKNLARLVNSWQAVDSRVRDKCKLVIAGATGWKVSHQLEVMQRDSSIVLLGSVPDAELQTVLQNALAFLYPSIYEGFGLPVVEAMSLGIPVMTSNLGATLEVAGNAALLVDPQSEVSITEGMTRLLSDPDFRRQLSDAGRRRAQEFSWVSAAELTLSTIERAAGS